MHLKVEVDYERLRFGYQVEGAEWQWLPQVFDASILSDEATAPGQPNFTGAFVGVACQDLAGSAMPADFDYFDYQERGFRPHRKAGRISDQAGIRIDRPRGRCLRGSAPILDLAATAAQSPALASEDGYKLWLRFAPPSDAVRRQYFRQFGSLVVQGDSPTSRIIRDEMTAAIASIVVVR